MIYVYILILELLIKYAYFNYSFDNVKVLINKELSNDFHGNIFSYPDSFFLNKINNQIIDNPKNIQHFPEKLINYDNYIIHEIFPLSYKDNKNLDLLIASNNNIIKLFLLENNQEKYFDEFCNNDLYFDKRETIKKVLYIGKILFILFNNKDLVVYKFSYKTTRNLLMNKDLDNNCFLDILKKISPVKDIIKLSFAKHIFITLDFNGRINLYNLKNYFMSRYNEFDIIKSLQLGYYENYYFAEIGLNHRFLIIGYDDRLTLIRIGSKIKIKKIYYLNNEFVRSLYTLDNYQILLGTNKGNLHLISVINSELNFDGLIHICENNIDLIAQEKVNCLICIKCDKHFKLIDLKGKFDEKDFIRNNKYKEFFWVFTTLVVLTVIKITKEKIKSFFKYLFSNNDEYEYYY